MSETSIKIPVTTALEQRVLPETIGRVVGLGGDFLNAKDVFGRDLREQIKSIKWKAMEIRGNNLPFINIFYTGEEEPSKEIDMVLDKFGKVVGILGFAHGDQPAFSVFIDPSVVGYTKGAGAFADSKEKMIWVKRSGFGLAHEITHLLVDSIACPDSELLAEGICAFVDWQAKTSQERVKDYVDDYELIARQLCLIPSIVKKISKEGIDVEFTKEELGEARIFGGLLFHTLVQDFGLTSQQIGQNWATTIFYEDVSSWIESLGLDSERVEATWMRRINSPLTELSVSYRTTKDILGIYIDTWKRRLGLSDD